MSNFFPDTNEEIVAEYEKHVKENGATKQRAYAKKKAVDLDGTEMTKIDGQLFDELFIEFKSLVETNSKTPFASFLDNVYLQEQEGYKDEIYKKARTALSFSNWKTDDIGTGKIFASVISAIKFDGNKNNLVNWRLMDRFEEKGKTEDLKKYEESIYNFYFDITSDEESLNDFVIHFGKNYPLIAYLFFIKNFDKYMPINPSYFDISFEKLGIVGFKTRNRCSWKNYTKYNELLSQVKDLLIQKGIKDISLLDAHSFVWMICKIEKKLDKAGII